MVGGANAGRHIPEVRGVVRTRLLDVLGTLWDSRFCLITAPAGFGKTTLLAHFAANLDRPVAWYGASGHHDSEEAFLAQLHRALARSLGAVSDGWRKTDDAILALRQSPENPALLVIDDFHSVGDTSCERVVEQLIHEAPTWLAIAVATRRPPTIDVARLRVSGRLLEIGSEDLRFRTWEVERLFGDVYRERLAPEESAHLARRTEGWAAGLQLFHLATRGKSPHERRRVLSELTGRSRMVREYLARNVLEAVSNELRTFLLETCVLGRLSPDVCDAFLLRDDSAERLVELDRLQLFVTRLDEEGSYRYHEVFRSYLEAALLELIGEGALHRRYREAGVLHERGGAHADALFAYCRAEEWEEAARLLGRSGREVLEELTDAAGLPLPAGLGLDPWMMLTLARQQRATGRWTEAIASYRKAEESFTSESGRELAQTERQQITAWTAPEQAFSNGWPEALKVAVAGDPHAGIRLAEAISGPHGLLAKGACLLLAGSLSEARRWLEEAAWSQESTQTLAAGATLLDAIAALLMGDHVSRDKAEWALEELSRLGVPWLENLAVVVQSLSGEEQRWQEIARVRRWFEHVGDPWGQALTYFLEGWGRLRNGLDASEVLKRAAAGFSQLRAPTLELWSVSALALALAKAGAPDVDDQLTRAEAIARSVEVRTPLAWATLARSLIEGAGGEHLRRLAEDLAAEGGLLSFDLDPPASEALSPPSPSIELRCFGAFELRIDGVRRPLDELRPRARSLLRLLALHKGRPVHREVLMEALWPNLDADTAVRNLHVAVSSLRQALEPGVTRGASSLVLRTGEAYRLALPPGTSFDLLAFDLQLRTSRAALDAGDEVQAIAALKETLRLQDGELLPEDGPADWVVKERERYRHEAVQAAETLVDLLFDRRDFVGAAGASRRALHLDRYNDGMWHRLIDALDRAEEEAAAERAREEYRSVLVELGVQQETPLPSSVAYP